MTVVAERAKNWLDNPAMDRVFKMIALVSLLAALFVGVRQYELTACLAEYNELSNANTQMRAAAAQEERENLDAMISAIAEAPSLPAADRPAAFQSALADYLRTRAYIDGKREVSPIPGPPSQTCG